MEFEIKTIKNEEENTTYIEVIFSNRKIIKTQIQNWNCDVDTNGDIARTVQYCKGRNRNKVTPKQLKKKGI